MSSPPRRTLHPPRSGRFTASAGPITWPGREPPPGAPPISARFAYPPIGRAIVLAIGVLGVGLLLWPLGHLTRWQWVADRQHRNLVAFNYATAQLKDWADRQKARRP